MKKYDAYYSKVKKKAGFTKKLYKYRILIICLLSIFTISLTGFLIAKGTILSNVDVKSEFVYGEEVVVNEPKALFSKTSYQYSKQGEDEWLDTKPTTPGLYNVRVASKGSFGIKKYSDPVQFTIKQRELSFELLNDKIVYGNNPDFRYDLVNGDSIEVEYSYKDYSKQDTTVVANVKDIKNNEGNSVLDLYSIPTIEKEIKFIPKDIKITPSVSDLVYNGQNIEVIKEDEKNLVGFNDLLSYDIEYFTKENGEYINIDHIPSTVGQYAFAVKEDSLSIMNNEISTLSNYSVNESSFAKHDFNITPREVDVITGSANKTYDGTPISDEKINNFKVKDESILKLVDGHTLTLLENKNIENVNANSSQNILVLDILDAENKSVKDNYKLNYTYGTLTIDKFKLNVKPHDVEDFTYNGKYVDYLENIESNYIEANNTVLPNNEEVKFNYKIIDDKDNTIDNPLNAGHYRIKFDGIISNSPDFNINNYDITYDNDVDFNILKVELNVKPHDVEDFTYNGKYVDYINNIESNYIELNDATLPNNEKVNFNFKIIDDDNNTIDNPRNAGHYRIKFNGINFDNSNIDINNYNIKYNNDVDFNILKRDLSVKPKSLDGFKYDGTNHYSSLYNSLNKSFFDFVEDTSLAENDSLYFDFKFVDGSGKEITDIKNVGTYNLYIDKVNYSYSSINLNNYNYDFKGFTSFDVTPRHIKVRPDVDYIDNKEYGKVELVDKLGCILIDGSDALGYQDSLSLKVVYLDEEGNELSLDEAKNIGTYKVKIIDYLINGKQSNNYTYEYDNKSTFTILPRHINVNIGDKYNYTYGDEAIKKLNNQLTLDNTSCGNNLMGEEKLVVNVNYTKGDQTFDNIKNAGIYKVNYLGVSSVIGGNKDNYLVTYSEDNIEIYTKLINYIPREFESRPFDGKETKLINNDNISFDGLVNNDKLNIEFTPNLIDSTEENGLRPVKQAIEAGSYKFKISNLTILDRENNDVTSNYCFNFDTTNFFVPYLITPRDIKVRIKNINHKYQYGEVIPSLEWEYINENDKIDGYDPNIHFIISGENVVTSLNRLNAGDYSIDYDRKLVNDNYEVIFETFNLRIDPFELKVSPKTEFIKDKTYDGKEVTYPFDINNFEIKNVTKDNTKIELPYGEQLKLKFNFMKDSTNYEVVKNAGIYELYLDKDNSEIINNDLTKGNVSNYNITYDDKIKYTIGKKRLTVKPMSKGKVIYDGTNHDKYLNGDILIDGVNGEKFKVVVSYSGSGITPINAGSYIIQIDSIEANDTNSNVENYEFNKETNSLTITKKDVTIELPKIDNFDYNGKYVEDSVVLNVNGLANNQRISANKLLFAKSEEDLKNKNYVFNVKNAGTYYYTIDTDNTFVSDYIDGVYTNTKEISVNYNVNFNNAFGKFTINKKDVRITIQNHDDLDYDHKTFDYFKFDYTVDELNKFCNENEKITNIYGTYYLVKDGQNIQKAENDIAYVGYYKFVPTSYKFSDESMANNYNIILTKEYSTLTIDRRRIEFTPSIVEKEDIPTNSDSRKNIIQSIVYGDTTYNSNDVIYNANGTIYEKYDISVKFNDNLANIVDAGRYTVNPTIKFKDEKMSDNYIISFKEGNVDINKRKVDIKLQNKYYDFTGNEISYFKDNKYTTFGVSGETITLTLTPMQGNIDVVNALHVGTYSYKVSKVDVKNGKPSNYKINNSDGMLNYVFKDILTIGKIDIKIGFNLPDIITYNGKRNIYPIYENNFRYIDGSKKLPESIKLTINPRIYDLNNKLLPYGYKDSGKYLLSINDRGQIDDSLISLNDSTYRSDFNIFCSDEEFRVNKQKLKIQVYDKDYPENNFDYNGKKYEYPEEYNNFKILEGQKYDGDDIQIDVEWNGIIKDAGSYIIKYVPKNYDNYEIEAIDMSLTINKKDLNIYLKAKTDYEYGYNYLQDFIDYNRTIKYLDNGDFVYNGIKTFKNGIPVNSIEDVGQYTFKIDESYYTNYNVKLDRNYINIIPYKIDLDPQNITINYDGKDHLNLTYEELSKIIEKSLNNASGIFQRDFERNLGKDFMFDIQFDAKEVKDSGTYEFTIKSLKNKNYEFNIPNKKYLLTINKKGVYIDLARAYLSKEYNGKPFSKKLLDETFKKLEMESSIKFDYELMFYDDTENKIIYDFNQLTDAGTYYVLVNPDSINFIGENVGDNYIIKPVNPRDSKAEIYIYRKNIYVQPQDVVYEYDGTVHDIPTNIVDGVVSDKVEPQLLNGDYIGDIRYSSKPTSPDIGYYQYHITDLVLFNKNGEPINPLYREGNNLVYKYRNYDFDLHYASYKITPRKIIVTGAGLDANDPSGKVIYDGKYHYATKVTTIGTPLGKGDYFDVRLENNPDGPNCIKGSAKKDTIDGPSDNKIDMSSFVIRNQDGKNVTSNYQIDIQNESKENDLIIHKRKLVFNLYINTLGNNRELIKDKNFTLGENCLVDGHTIKAILINDPDDGIRTVKVTIKDENGYDVSHNYDVDLIKVRGGLNNE